MEKLDDKFKSIFTQLKECHSCFFPTNPKYERDHPIRKLFEAFSLCSGAFYNLYAYQHYYRDLSGIPENTNEESWKIFSEIDSYKGFFNLGLHPSKIIQPDFRSMSIANAAFRLSAASELVCDVIQKIDLNECEICENHWPYQRFFNPDPKRRSWKRELLHKKDKNWLDSLDKNILVRNLSLLVALRDEYGHSEFQEGRERRTEIRDRYRDHIVEAEIEILQTCLVTIRSLFENHYQKLTEK